MTLSARVVAQPSARRELLQALLNWVTAVKREAGIVAASVAEDAEVPAVFHLSASWESAAGLDAHIRSDAFGILLGGVGVLAESIGMTVSRPIDDYGGDALPAIRRLRRERAEIEETT